MSWSNIAVGKSADVKEKFTKQAAAIMFHQSAAARTIISGHVAAVIELCDNNPDFTIIAESNGHLDASGGNADLRIRKLYG